MMSALRLAAHPERVALAVEGVVVEEIREHRRRAAERLSDRDGLDVDRQVVHQRQLGGSQRNRPVLVCSAGLQRRVERIRDRAAP